MPRGRRQPVRGARLTIWRAALLYVAVTVALAYPLTIHPAGHVLSSSADTNLYMWTLQWDVHALTHSPWSIFDANIFYPQRNTLAYSENVIGSSIVAAPILWATQNPVLTLNLVVLVSTVLCGVGAFVLARALGIGSAAAVLSGLIFAFSPPRFFRLEQLHLATIQWMPFSLAFLHRYLNEGRRRDLRYAAMFFTLQAVTSGHGTALLVAASLVLIGYRLALGEPVAIRQRLRDLGVPGVLAFAPALLIFIPYHRVQVDMHLVRSVNEWPTEPSSFLASPARFHALVLSALGITGIDQSATAYLFPGYLPVGLAVAAIVCRRTKRVSTPDARCVFWTRTAALVELIAVAALAVGVVVAAFGVLRARWGATVYLSIRGPERAWIVAAAAAALRIGMTRRAPFDVMPRLRRGWESIRRWANANRRSVVAVYTLITIVSVWLAAGASAGLWPLVYWLPGLSFIRVPSRFMLLAVLGLAVLAGIGFERVTIRLTPHTRRLAAILAAVWLVVEFSAAPLGTERYAVDIPAIDRWLGRQPMPFVIAEVPLDGERRHSEYMLHSTAHWQKTIEGYSGLLPPLHEQLYRELAQFPDAASIDGLLGLGVNYIVIHDDLYAPAERARVDAGLAQFRDWLTLAHAEQGGRIYALHQRSAPSAPTDRLR